MYWQRHRVFLLVLSRWSLEPGCIIEKEKKKDYEKNFKKCVFLPLYFGHDKEMGGDMFRVEPIDIEDNMRKPCTWIMLKEGGLVSFMEAMVGYDENFSQQTFSSLINMRVMINKIYF